MTATRQVESSDLAIGCEFPVHLCRHFHSYVAGVLSWTVSRALLLVLMLLMATPLRAEDCLSHVPPGRFIVYCPELTAVATLKGQWLMIEGEWVAPEQLDEDKLAAATALTLPGLMTRKALFESKVVMATLIADVEFPNPVYDLEMAPGWVNSSHRIFVRDRAGRYVKVFTNAELEKLGSEDAGRLSTLPVLLPDLGRKTRIVIHIHNGPYPSPGISEIVALAPRGLLIRQHESRQALLTLFIGVFLTIAFYNVLLWHYYRDQWEGLLLALIAVLFCARNIALGGLLETFSPASTQKLYSYIGWYTYLGVMAVWPMYFRKIFPELFRRWMLLLCSTPIVFVLLAGLFVSLADFVLLGTYVRNFIWLAMSLVVYATVVSAYRRHGVGLITLLGLLLMIASTAVDVSYYARGTRPIVEFTNLGYLAFVLLQTVAITRSYIRSLRESEPDT